MKVAAAESAVLDSAAQREMNAAKQEKANADAAALLAKEKRKALEAVEQANAAMREAKDCKQRRLRNMTKQRHF